MIILAERVNVCFYFVWVLFAVGWRWKERSNGLKIFFPPLFFFFLPPRKTTLFIITIWNPRGDVNCDWQAGVEEIATHDASTLPWAWGGGRKQQATLLFRCFPGLNSAFITAWRHEAAERGCYMVCMKQSKYTVCRLKKKKKICHLPRIGKAFGTCSMMNRRWGYRFLWPLQLPVEKRKTSVHLHYVGPE